MDFKKQLIVYASILGVLVVLFVVGAVVQAASMGPQGEKVFPQFSADAAAKITVTDQKGAVEVDKAGGGWRVAVGGKTFDASKTAIDTLLKNFADVRKRDVVTANKDKWLDFNVDESHAVRVVVAAADGKPLADCYFGKGGTTSFSQYVRLPGAPDVIQTDVRIEKTTALKEWAEMRLFPDAFYVDDIDRILYKTSLVFNDQAKSFTHDLAYTLIPGEKNKEGYTTWKIAESERFPISPQKVSSLANSIAGFAGDDLVQDPAKLKLDPAHPAGSVAVRLKSGKTYTLSLLGSVAGEPDSYYVTNQDAKYIYTANNFGLRAIFSDASALIDPGALLAPR